MGEHARNDERLRITETNVEVRALFIDERGNGA